MDRAGELWDSFNDWYKDHPEATFDEMEEKLGEKRRAVLGDFLELSLRQGDLGATARAPNCPKCGKPAEFKGYPPKTVHGLDVDLRFPRAYYHCPNCQEGFFPPGAPTTIEER
jgi:hypothetical protein